MKHLFPTLLSRVTSNVAMSPAPAEAAPATTLVAPVTHLTFFVLPGTLQGYLANQCNLKIIIITNNNKMIVIIIEKN